MLIPLFKSCLLKLCSKLLTFLLIFKIVGEINNEKGQEKDKIDFVKLSGA
jgi:hypothetical protein